MLKEITTKIAEYYDNDTFAHSNGKQLFLVGEKTPFLEAIKRKATNLNIYCSYKNEDFFGKIPTVVDTESYTKSFVLTEWQDIDKIQHEGISCCASAIIHVLGELDVGGKNVTIIGRGHAVQGLVRELVKQDATVTVCHSKTRSVHESTIFADILVVAAPINTEQINSLDKKIVIDVSGTFKGFVPEDRYIGNIGKLTTSILLNRACKA